MRTYKKLIKLLKSKKSTNQIKEELGISGPTLSRLSKGYGISLVERNKLIREDKSPKILFLGDSKIIKKVIKQIKKGRSRLDITNKYDISTYRVSTIAKDNGLIIKRPSRHDKFRHKDIVKLIKKGELTYKEIGVKFDITRQRVYQFAKEYDLRRNVKSKKKKIKLIKKIEKDINNGVSYSDLISKHELTESKINGLKYHGFNGNLPTRYRKLRNDVILKEYKIKAATEVLKSTDEELNDPNRINTVASVYNIASTKGFKKYPNIPRGMKGIFVDDEVKKIIRRRKNSTKKYTCTMIADELNKKGLKSAYGRDFNWATVNNIWTKMKNTTGRTSKITYKK